MATTLTERFRFISPVQTETPFHVTGFTGVEGLHRLFDFHIDLVCADAAVDTGKLLAAPCRFEILRDGDAAPAVFSGYPARVEQRGFFNGYAYYSVHLRPTLWKLTQLRQSAVFLNKKLEDVLRELINSQTFFQFPHEFRLTAGDYPAPEFAMQYQETLYDYICWRMEEQGAYFYFEEKDGALCPVEDTVPGSWVAPSAHWAMAYALGAFLKPNLHLSNPGVMTSLFPLFWNLYNTLPRPELKRKSDQEVEDAKPARRRVIAQGVYGELPPEPVAGDDF